MMSIIIRSDDNDHADKVDSDPMTVLIKSNFNQQMLEYCNLTKTTGSTFLETAQVHLNANLMLYQLSCSLRRTFRILIYRGEKLLRENCLSNLGCWSKIFADWLRMICILVGVTGSSRFTLSPLVGVSAAQSLSSLSLTRSPSALVA